MRLSVCYKEIVQKEVVQKGSVSLGILGVSYAILTGKFDLLGQTIVPGRLGLAPCFLASGIIRFLTMFVPRYHQMTKEGGTFNEKKLKQFSMFIALLLAAAESSMHAAQTGNYLSIPFEVATTFGLVKAGEISDKKGISKNGSSLIFIMQLFSGALKDLGNVVLAHTVGELAMMGALLLPLLAFTMVYMDAECKIPVANDKYKWLIPIKLSMPGIMPLVYTSSAIFLLSPNLYPLFAAMIVFLAIYMAKEQFNTYELAKKFKRLQCYVGGIRAGKDTKTFLDTIVKEALCIGIPILLFLAFYPILMMHVTSLSFTHLAFAAPILLYEGRCIMRSVKSYALDYDELKIIKESV